jgi:hypothetical protein
VTTPPSRPPWSWNGEGEVLGMVPLLRAEGGEKESQFFFIVGGLYSVTALRENDHARVTVYTKHRLTLQAPVTEALGS